MSRNIHYKIEARHHGKAIGTFLKEKEYSRGVIIELKKTQTGIMKNGIWAGVNEVLNEGDLLEIALVENVASENIVPRDWALDILYEDEDLLVINKPYDMPIHPSVNNYDNTLANGVMYYFKQQDANHVFRCINRLDRDTTGVTLVAKNLLSASILAKRMEERQLGRTYVAFAEGQVEEEGIIDLPIGREEGSIIKRQIDLREGKEAITHYRRLGTFKVGEQDVSVVALRLETGRTHQIRVHMAAIGHPLLGDFLYNESNHMLSRQALHGAVCHFHHPITGDYHMIMAPLHKDMADLLAQQSVLEVGLYDLEATLRELTW